MAEIPTVKVPVQIVTTTRHRPRPALATAAFYVLCSIEILLAGIAVALDVQPWTLAGATLTLLVGAVASFATERQWRRS